MRQIAYRIAPLCLGLGLFTTDARATMPVDAREESLILVMSAAVDTDCDGDLNDETTENALFDEAKVLVPGECIIYRTDYRNDGDFPIRKVEVRTPVPKFMIYVPDTAEHIETPPGLWPRTPNPPLNGKNGDVVWGFSGGLGPGEAGRVEFRVKLVP